MYRLFRGQATRNANKVIASGRLFFIYLDSENPKFYTKIE